MATPARSARTPAKAAAGKAAAGKTARKPAAKAGPKSPTSVAIATELAPAVAIALLDKTPHQDPDAPAPALDCLAAGATASETEGKVRVQLMFENGAVLPVEMSQAAGAALSKGLAAELPKK